MEGSTRVWCAEPANYRVWRVLELDLKGRDVELCRNRVNVKTGVRRLKEFRKRGWYL